MTTAVLPARTIWRWPAHGWALLVAAVAIAWQSLTALDCDVSWLLTTAERVADGATLYRDIEEVNPPASVLLYMPAVALARALAVPAEMATVALVVLLAALSLAQAGRLLAPPAATRGWLAAAAAYVLLVLPAGVFAQREHVALLAGLPILALLVVRAEGRAVSATDSWRAGLGAGIMVAIKPHLLLALLPVGGWAVWRRWRHDAARLDLASVRSDRRTRGTVLAWLPEWLVLAAVCLAYAALVAIAFPRYLDRMLPLLRLVYLPGRDTWANLLTGPAMLLTGAAAGLALWLARGRPTAPTVAALLAALGFAAASLLQGKGYLNHGYPALAMALLAVALQLGRGGEERRFGAICGVLLAAAATWTFAALAQPYAIRDAVARAGPAQPRLIAVTYDFGLGHPLTRWVDGSWVGRRGSLWATGNARQQLERPALTPSQRAAFAAVEREDAAMLAADIVRGRPDVVLVDDNPGPGWIDAHPAVARALAPYRPGERVGAVTLWVRR